MDTVVLDGKGQLNIEQGVNSQIVTGGASGAVSITADGNCSITLTSNADCDLVQTIDGQSGVVTVVHMADLPFYTGATSVIPKAHDEQVLQTQNKIVLDNITITEVPYWETSNSSGMTVFIANEV